MRQCLSSLKLSKERNRGIEATSETVHHLTSGNKREEKKDKRDQGGRDDKDENQKLIRKCKFCGRQHRRGNCPTYGVECQKCHKSNHFASFCISRRPKPAHTVESDDDYDEIKTVELNPVDEINAVAARKFPKRLFATINVGEDASTLSAR